VGLKTDHWATALAHCSDEGSRDTLIPT
jgi:hypothetical protein